MEIQHSDLNGFRLPEYIPLDLWHQYLHVLQEHNIVITNQRKAQWALSLSRLYSQHHDLRPIMQQSIEKQWLGFYAVSCG